MQISKKRIQHILNSNNQTRKKRGINKKHNKKRRRSGRTSKARKKNANLRYKSLKNRKKQKGGAFVNKNKEGVSEKAKLGLAFFEEKHLEEYLKALDERILNNPVDAVDIIENILGQGLEQKIKLAERRQQQNLFPDFLQRWLGTDEGVGYLKEIQESIKALVTREKRIANEGMSYVGRLGGDLNSGDEGAAKMKELIEIAANTKNGIPKVKEILDKYNFGIGADAALTVLIIEQQKDLEVKMDFINSLMWSGSVQSRVKNAQSFLTGNGKADTEMASRNLVESYNKLAKYVAFYSDPGRGFITVQSAAASKYETDGAELQNNKDQRKILVDYLAGQQLRITDLIWPRKDGSELFSTIGLTLEADMENPSLRISYTGIQYNPLVQSVINRANETSRANAKIRAQELQAEMDREDAILADKQAAKRDLSEAADSELGPSSRTSSGTSVGSTDTELAGQVFADPLSRPPSLQGEPLPRSADPELEPLSRTPSGSTNRSPQDTAESALRPELQERMRDLDNQERARKTVRGLKQQAEDGDLDLPEGGIEMGPLKKQSQSTSTEESESVYLGPKPRNIKTPPMTKQESDLAQQRVIEIERIMRIPEPAEREAKMKEFFEEFEKQTNQGFKPVDEASLNEEQQKALFEGRQIILNSCLVNPSSWTGIVARFNEEERQTAMRGSDESVKPSVFLCPLVKQEDEKYGVPVEQGQIQSGYEKQEISGSYAYCGFIGMLYYSVQIKDQYKDYWNAQGVPPELNTIVEQAANEAVGDMDKIDYINNEQIGLSLMKEFLQFVRRLPANKNPAPIADTFAYDADLNAYAGLLGTTICVWESQKPIPYWEYYDGAADGRGVSMIRAVVADVDVPPPCFMLHQDKPVGHFDYINLTTDAKVFQEIGSEYFGTLYQMLLTANAKVDGSSLPSADGQDAPGEKTSPNVKARMSGTAPETSTTGTASKPATASKDTSASEDTETPFGVESVSFCPSRFPNSDEDNKGKPAWNWVSKNMTGNCGPPNVLPNYFKVFGIQHDIAVEGTEGYNDYMKYINDWIAEEFKNDNPSVDDKNPAAYIAKQRSIRCIVPLVSMYDQIIGYLGAWTPAFKKLVEKRFTKLAMKYHPDRNNKKSAEEQALATAKFNCIGTAKEILANEENFYYYTALWTGCSARSYEKQQKDDPNYDKSKRLQDYVSTWPPTTGFVPYDDDDNRQDKDGSWIVAVGSRKILRVKEWGGPISSRCKGFWEVGFKGPLPATSSFSSIWPKPPPAHSSDLNVKAEPPAGPDDPRNEGRPSGFVIPSGTYAGGADGDDKFRNVPIMDPVTQRWYYSTGTKTVWEIPGIETKPPTTGSADAPAKGTPTTTFVPGPSAPSGADTSGVPVGLRGMKLNPNAPDPVKPSGPSATVSDDIKNPEASGDPEESQDDITESDSMQISTTRKELVTGDIEVSIRLVMPPKCAPHTTINTTGNAGTSTQAFITNYVKEKNGVATSDEEEPSAPPAVPALTDAPSGPPDVPALEDSRSDADRGAPSGELKIVNDNLLIGNKTEMKIPKSLSAKLNLGSTDITLDPETINQHMARQFYDSEGIPDWVKATLAAVEEKKKEREGKSTLALTQGESQGADDAALPEYVYNIFATRTIPELEASLAKAKEEGLEDAENVLKQVIARRKSESSASSSEPLALPAPPPSAVPALGDSSKLPDVQLFPGQPPPPPPPKGGKKHGKKKRKTKKRRKANKKVNTSRRTKRGRN